MLTPDFYYESVYMIPYADLWQNNYRALIFDLDNTLAPHEVLKPPAKVVALIKRLHKIGFKVCILTNNTKKRVRTYNEGLQVTAIHCALKPFAFGVNRAIKALGHTRDQTIIIGDQLFSDIWAGKNARITTILVKPLTTRDVITVRIKRLPERLLLKRYFRKLAEEVK